MTSIKAYALLPSQAGVYPSSLQPLDPSKSICDRLASLKKNLSSSISIYDTPEDAFEIALWRSREPFSQARTSTMFKISLDLTKESSLKASKIDDGWRIQRKRIDGKETLNSGYLEEFVKKHPLSSSEYFDPLMATRDKKIWRWASHLPNLNERQTKKLIARQRRAEIRKKESPADARRESLKRLADETLLSFRNFPRALNVSDEDNLTLEETTRLFKEEDKRYLSALSPESEQKLRRLAERASPLVAISSANIAKPGLGLITAIVNRSFRVAVGLSEKISLMLELSLASMQGWAINPDNPKGIMPGDEVKVRPNVRKRVPDYPFHPNELVTVQEIGEKKGELLVSGHGPIRESLIPISTVERIKISRIEKNRYHSKNEGEENDSSFRDPLNELNRYGLYTDEDGKNWEVGGGG